MGQVLLLLYMSHSLVPSTPKKVAIGATGMLVVPIKLLAFALYHQVFVNMLYNQWML